MHENYRKQREMGLTDCDLFWICSSFFVYWIKFTNITYIFFLWIYANRNNNIRTTEIECAIEMLLLKNNMLERIGIQLTSSKQTQKKHTAT